MLRDLELHPYTRWAPGTYQQRETDQIQESSLEELYILRKKYEQALQQFPEWSGEGYAIFKLLLEEVNQEIYSSPEPKRDEVRKKSKRQRKVLQNEVSQNEVDKKDLSYRDEWSTGLKRQKQEQQTQSSQHIPVPSPHKKEDTRVHENPFFEGFFDGATFQDKKQF